MSEGGDWVVSRVWALMMGSSTGAASSRDAPLLGGPVQSLTSDGLIIGVRASVPTMLSKVKFA
jgi:hypothetical protein